MTFLVIYERIMSVVVLHVWRQFETRTNLIHLLTFIVSIIIALAMRFIQELVFIK